MGCLPLPPIPPPTHTTTTTHQSVLLGVPKLPPLAQGQAHVHALQAVSHLAGGRAHESHGALCWGGGWMSDKACVCPRAVSYSVLLLVVRVVMGVGGTPAGVAWGGRGRRR